MTLHPHLQALAWALIHFLWQGLLLGLAAALAFRLRRGSHPQTRYVLGLGFMGLALASPLITWWILHSSPALPPLPGPSELGEITEGFATSTAEPLSLHLRLRLALASALPWILGVWAVGSTALALRLAGGWLWLQRLKARMEPLEEVWEARLRDLAHRMGFHRAFRAGLSREITSPLVIGWIRPVLLLPASLLTGMDPMGVEALLAHEVAHLRRYDVLFNWMQCAVEVLLFYHPAVWWLSRRTRLERECACDDAAVAYCGDPLRYAETLNLLDDLQTLDLIPAQAAHGANLMYRITRLLTPKVTAPRLPLVIPTLAFLCAGALALSARTPHSAPAPTMQTPAPQPAPKPARPKAERKSEAQPTPPGQAAPETRKEASAPRQNRFISFELWVTKTNGPRLNLRVTNATRAEVETALSRIESLVKPDMDRSDQRGPVEGHWDLKPYQGSSDDLLSLQLKQVTPTEARQLF